MEASVIRTLILLSALAACTQDASQPDAGYVCGPDANTQMNGNASYPCTTGEGQAGLCTTDSHGAYTCFPSCGPQFSCPTGSSTYVLFLADDSRVCYCVVNGAP